MCHVVLVCDRHHCITLSILLHDAPHCLSLLDRRKRFRCSPHAWTNVYGPATHALATVATQVGSPCNEKLTADKKRQATTTEAVTTMDPDNCAKRAKLQKEAKPNRVGRQARARAWQWSTLSDARREEFWAYFKTNYPSEAAAVDMPAEASHPPMSPSLTIIVHSSIA